MAVSEVNQFWQKMIDFYGHKWLSSYGPLYLMVEGHSIRNPSVETWAEALSGIPVETIKLGLERCLTRTEEWPPTLPEFRQLCLKRTGEQVYHDFTHSLPEPATLTQETQDLINRERHKLGLPPRVFE